METQTQQDVVIKNSPSTLQADWLLYIRRGVVFMIGLFVMSYGIVAVIHAKFGVSPWDVLHLGISMQTGFNFGRVQQLLGILILAVACILAKKWPTIGAIANLVLVGEFCNLIIDRGWVPDPDQLWIRSILFIGGILLWGFGGGIYIASQLGAGPRDWLMLAIHEKTGWAIRWVRTGLEVIAVIIGFFLGGPFFWGTIVFSLTIGHTTEFGIVQSKRWLQSFVERS